MSYKTRSLGVHAWVVGAILVLAPSGFARADEDKTITVASTTSTQDSGLFDYLLPIFKRKTGITVKVIAVGTGQALPVSICERGAECANDQEGQNQQHLSYDVVYTAGDAERTTTWAVLAMMAFPTSLLPQRPLGIDGVFLLLMIEDFKG